MAVMTLYTQYNMNAPIDGGGDEFAVYNTGTEAVVTDGMYGILVQGTGLTLDSTNGFTAGTANSIYVASSLTGNSIYSVTGASIDWAINDVYDTGYDTNADGENDVWGMQAEQAYWLRSADTIYGSAYGDVLNGYLGNDKIYGYAGEDILTGGQGNDTLDGGAGYDISVYNDLRVTTGTSPVTYKFLSTGSLASGSVAVSEVVSGVTTLKQTDTLISIEELRGTKVADNINFSTSTGNQDGFQGFAGNDTIIGGDVLSAGTTTNDGDYIDYRYLPLSSMHVNVNLTNTDSTTSYATAQVYWSTSTTISETDSLRKIHGVIGTGGNDVVTGSAADDWFRGMGGNDSFTGGAGSDWIDYRWDSSALNVTLSAGGATQTIAAGAHGNDTISGVENIAGGLAADILTGNELSNSLRGREGNDTIDGAGGFDYADYKNATGLTVTWSSATSATSSGADGIDTLTNIEGVKGSIDYGDKLTGSTGSQAIYGRGGNDTINGGLGNDTLDGGTGNDQYVFNTATASNIDSILSFTTAADKIVLENSIFTGLGTTTGNFVASDARFYAAAGATAVHDSTDRIIYNTTNGALYYDADGIAGNAVQIAIIGTHPTLAATDLTVI